MRSFTALILFAVTSTWVLSAQASQISVQGVNITYSCGYFSNYSEKLHITYVNGDLPAGTEVQLHWGLGGYTPRQDERGNLQESPIDWENTSPGQDLLMTQTQSNPPTYEITLEADTHDRSSNNFFTQFKFSFIQDQPSGTYYDRPGSYGYYEVDFTNNGSCFQNDRSYPLNPLNVIWKSNG